MPSDQPARRRRIWVTRAQPGADATALRLRALGFEPVVAPVLVVRPIAGAVIALAGVDALAFTSAAGVAAFASLSDVRALPAFTVGDATAEAARTSGFADVRSAGADAIVLADLITAATPRPRLVLNPTAAEPAADLEALLQARGVQARSTSVYQTCETNLAVAPADLDGVLVHSAKGAAAVTRLLAREDVSAVTAYAISPAAATPLAALGLRGLAVAAAPTEAALLALLES
jgi:uroporphyrinogen-III synthase